VKYIIFLFAFFLSANIGFAQLPDIFDLELDCPSANDEELWDGRYIKSETVSPVVSQLGGGIDCGCWDRQGTDDILTVISAGVFLFVHSEDVIGGCANANSVGAGGSISLENPSGDCVLENFDGIIVDSQTVGCTNFTLTAVNVDPVPTLSQWGLIILGLFLIIFGVVEISQRRLV